MLPPGPLLLLAAPSLCAAIFTQEPAQLLPRLAAPFVVEAGSAPIAAATGHAAPFVLDFDGDGRHDLVVGEFGDAGGRARIYLNVGTDSAPRFEDFTWLQAGGADAIVPSS